MSLTTAKAVAVTLLLTVAAHGQSIQIKLQNETTDALTPAESVLSAAHVNDGLDGGVHASWNNFSINAPGAGVTQFDQVNGSSLIDSEGSATGAFLLFDEGLVDVNFGDGFTGGGFNGAEDTLNPGNSGTNGNGLYEEVWFTRPGEGGLAFLVAGLAAADYRVYYYATESNNDDRAYDVTFQTTSTADLIATAADGVNDPIAAGNNTTEFIDGLNYSAFDITVGAGENLVIFSSVNNVGDGAGDFASVGAFQIIAIDDLPVPGDVDGDGDVDLADFNGPDGIFNNFFNGVAGGAAVTGEAFGAIDGIVDINDFVVWKREFEAAGGSTVGISLFGATPEPSSALLLALSVAACPWIRGRRSA